MSEQRRPPLPMGWGRAFAADSADDPTRRRQRLPMGTALANLWRSQIAYLPGLRPRLARAGGPPSPAIASLRASP